MKKLQTFWNLSLFEKSLFFKAFFLSAYVRFATCYLPMRWWNKSLLGKQVNLSDYFTGERLVKKDKLELHKTIQMVRLACCYAPWETKCLVESILVKRLYSKIKNLPICLGLNKIGDNYFAHAWVKIEEPVHYKYNVVSVHI